MPRRTVQIILDVMRDQFEKCEIEMGPHQTDQSFLTAAGWDEFDIPSCPTGRCS